MEDAEPRRVDFDEISLAALAARSWRLYEEELFMSIVGTVAVLFPKRSRSDIEISLRGFSTPENNVRIRQWPQNPRWIRCIALIVFASAALFLSLKFLQRSGAVDRTASLTFRPRPWFRPIASLWTLCARPSPFVLGTVGAISAVSSISNLFAFAFYGLRVGIFGDFANPEWMIDRIVAGVLIPATLGAIGTELLYPSFGIVDDKRDPVGVFAEERYKPLAVVFRVLREAAFYSFAFCLAYIMLRGYCKVMWEMYQTLFPAAPAAPPRPAPPAAVAGG